MTYVYQRGSISTVILNLILLILIAICGLYLYNHREALQTLIFPTKPCEKPIHFSIGYIDPRFNISTSTVMERLEKASSIWSKAMGKALFVYDPNGSLKVNFSYDNRQDATNQLKELGYKISNDQSSYDELKSKYDSLKLSLVSDKASIDADTNAFNAASAAYKEEVDRWNEQGGATKEVYARLTQTQTQLKTQSAALQQRIDTYNQKTKEINSLITVINRIADALNIKAVEANQISKTRDKEFEEGEYVVDQGKKEINIYEFDSQERLTRVLAHEFGHALGLEHVDDPKAIMYYLNQEKTLDPTRADVSALTTLCHQP